MSGQKQIRSFMYNYKNLPASFADSCLVYLYETITNSNILTLDSDFTIYRDQQGKPLELLTP